MSEININLSAGMPIDEEDEQYMQDDREKKLVLRKIISDPDLFHSLSGHPHLDLGTFFIDSPMCSFIWPIVSEYYEDYQELPSEDFFIEDCAGRFPAFRNKYQDAVSLELSEIKAFIQEAYQYRGPLNKTDRQLINGIISSVQRKEIQGIINEELDEGTPLSEVLEKVKVMDVSSVTKDAPGRKVILKPLEEQARLFSENPKRTLHVEFLDNLFGGGLAKGDAAGFAIPSGAGKTTLVWQVAYMTAMAQEHAVIATIEQDYGTDLQKRIAVLASGATRDMWEKVCPEEGVINLNQLPEENRRRYAESLDLMNTYIHVVDEFNESDVAVPSMKEFYARCMEHATDTDPSAPVSVFEIDWWGPLRTRLLMSMPINFAKGDALTRYYQQELQRCFKNESKRHHTRTLVMQQIRGEMARKKHGTRVTSGDAQEDSNFNNMFDYCGAFGQLNPEDYSTSIFLDKARAGRKTKTDVILDGNRCMFIPNNIEHGGSLIESMEAGKGSGLDDSAFVPTFSL